MNKEEKMRMLQALSEKELTKKFLIPLYESPGMGCKNVRYTHRRLEFGKDVIYYKVDEYGNRIYTGIQVKKTKITTKDIDGIQRQVQEAFGEPFTDLSDGKKRELDRVVVLTSSQFAEEAKDSFWANMKAIHREKMVSCVEGGLLVELLDKHLLSAFWDEYDLFNKYFNAMQRDFTTIKDVSAIGQKESVSLDSIYVSLRVSEEITKRQMPAEKDWKIFDDQQLKDRLQQAPQQKERAKVVDADRAVADYERLVIVGDPGSGKTTLLKHLALKWCIENLQKQQRLSVPVPIVLRQLADSNKGIRQYIDTVFEKYDFPNAKKWIEKDLKQGKCRLLLDGFDELATKQSQEKVAKEIEKFSHKYRKIPVLVTSRIAGYHDELRGFTKAELLEFDDDQIARFTENWFGQKHQGRAKSMLAAIKGNQQIKALARNPLMIAIIAIIYEEDRKLPERRADLYQRCIEVLLSKWDVQKRLKNKYPPDKKRFILSKLGFYGHTNNKRIMTDEEIRAQMLEHFPRLGLKEKDLNGFLEEIWQRSFLLREVSMDSYDFLHLSFQEYFTALELTESEDATDIILNHLTEPWWQEPILLYAGIKKDATALITTIEENVPEDIFHSNLMLCAKCVADADFTDPSLKDKIIDRLYELYEADKFYSLTNSAIEILGRINPDKIIDNLKANLTADDASVRSSAAYSLGKTGSEKASEPLLKALKDQDSNVRRNAASALGIIGSEKVIDPLLKDLKDKDSIVRESAAYALGEIGSEKAIGPLIKARKDKDRGVHWYAVYALGKIGSEKAIGPLLKDLKGKDRDVRWIAPYALGKIGSDKAIEPLLKALKDKDINVRSSAADALGKIGSEKAIDPLIKNLKNKHHDVRRSAAYALGTIGSEKAIEPMLLALKDKDSGVCGRVAYALGKIGSDKAIEPLLLALKDGDSDIRRGAADALGEIGSEKAIEPLLLALKDKDRDVRRIATDALGTIGSDKAIEPLLLALKDKDSTVCNHAAYALGAIGSEKAIDPLLLALKDVDRFIRMSAAYALGEIGSDQAIDPLLLALKDEDSNVRNSIFVNLMAISKKCRRRIIAPLQ